MDGWRFEGTRIYSILPGHGEEDINTGANMFFQLVSWLSLSRDELGEGLRKASLKYNSPHVRLSAVADLGEGHEGPLSYF